MDEVEKLAVKIASCCEVQEALNSTSHPCHEVVRWQSKQWSSPILQIENSQMHRPEAWTGDIVNAPILFLSSNPSFDPEENYPNWNEEEWPTAKVSDFAINRFTSNIGRGYGATDGLSSDEIDRTVDKNGQLSDKVKYWGWARRMVAYIYGKKIEEVSAHSDYAMTEIVHCKSQKEEGVKKARETCKGKYLEPILAISKAKLIIVDGQHACENLKAIFPDKFPKTWGRWNADGTLSGGFWPETIKQFPTELAEGKWSLVEQKKHQVTFNLAGQDRTFQFFAKPGGGGGLNTPWNHPDLVHTEVLNGWRALIGL